jgi:hypothetical protein
VLVKLRREYLQLVTSGAQLLLLFVGFRLGSRNGWLICLALMAALSILAWLSALKRLRSVRDTPTSKIASAAQGYVELAGDGESLGETPLLGKLSLLPCLWYRYRIEKRGQKNQWQTIESGESVDSFMLRDDTGVCIVDPERAEIITLHRNQWRAEQHRYTEWQLLKNDQLYVIGQFRTQGGSTADFNSRAALNNLLGEWKKDMPGLHSRFDLDNNGTLDMQEWMLARSAAKREVGKQLRAAQSAPDFHIMRQPDDGKLFLISNLDQNALSRRYLFWSLAHLLIFFGALIGTGWILHTPVDLLGLRP